MSLSDSIDEFRSMINRLVDQLEEVSSASRTIPSTEVDQLSQKLAELMENLEEADGQMRTATELLDEIRSTWG
ncbi:MULTISPECIES: hypothetical protein [unclassified Roseofilum]|uniref:hypothetical protein n=1 Tax=unclassified Roseofilum TaxID=2620099 RepID=UPI000E7F7E94|nr:MULTISPECIES: hypothetical protein [unclassified Roseofilum]MBP0008686.1 hypothetical protein [Roseofilum sp. Belize Diploria]MBP0025478.1 hypothetical protein [Roseofilum sp. SID2]MBP0033095.1 hypothetical protein [Roseofilum sp. Belize BBD 4]HBR00469.1 hypothetical protein [Cyanobacteria bacterium UBA11691]